MNDLCGMQLSLRLTEKRVDLNVKGAKRVYTEYEWTISLDPRLPLVS